MKRRILIVDDQPGIRLLLTDVFLSEGYEVSVATTGIEALKKTQNHSFDLILLDYRLPIINGVEVIKQMMQDNNETPVILMSGLIEGLREELLHRKDGLAIVSKPFNIKDLRELANSLITIEEESVN